MDYSVVIKFGMCKNLMQLQIIIMYDVCKFADKNTINVLHIIQLVFTVCNILTWKKGYRKSFRWLQPITLSAHSVQYSAIKGAGGSNQGKMLTHCFISLEKNCIYILIL